jgi:hypothetical protein
VERNWLSIRRSPCNKRSKCWSVLMCCETNFLSWVIFWKKKVCIPCGYLVIKVCNQGKTLCSPCILWPISPSRDWNNIARSNYDVVGVPEHTVFDISQIVDQLARHLATTYRTWACPGHICKGCKGEWWGTRRERSKRKIGSSIVD